MNPAYFLQWYADMMLLQARAAHDFLASLNPFFYSSEDLKKEGTIMQHQSANQNNPARAVPMTRYVATANSYSYGNAATTEIIRVPLNKR